jgi:hypothetical protein
MTRMSYSDRLAWKPARTLADLGHLTARWLEGDLASVPCYDGAPDDETLPLVPVLAAANCAGYVTGASQPGMTSRRWVQRAAVQGFAGDAMAARIRDAARAAGLLVVAHSPRHLPRWRTRYRCRCPVTLAGGQVFTAFGAHLSRRFLHGERTGYGICHPDAVASLCSAWQVTVIDPEWGREGLLWRVLAEGVSA